MATEAQKNEAAFEQEVRDIARHLWPQSEFGGARLLDGKQHDGVFETEDCVHFVEATVSSTSKKAQDDIAKMVKQADKTLRTIRNKTVQCWFVTRGEPTAEQRQQQLNAESKHGIKINAISSRQFQGRIVDATRYLAARDHHVFGSVRDPATGAISPTVPYIPLEFTSPTDGPTWNSKRLTSALLEGGRHVLLGDYGAGKSMTLREIYHVLRRKFLNGSTLQFPIHINLREHWGQTDAVEVLERHARRIGYDHPAHLVRAWRAGFGVLIIDGFDEVASGGLASAWRKLRDNRFRAMAAVREFMRDTPKRSGIIISGRAQFFDSIEERKQALGLDEYFVTLTAADFTDAQIRKYIGSTTGTGVLPAWLPSRPLLIAYLVSKNIVLANEPLAGLDPAEGWNGLLDRIAAREAEIEAGIDGATVRRLIERIATVARRTLDGLGPLVEADLVDAFKDVTGFSPEEQALVLIQRLPGLGVARSGASDRSFVDADFADVCRTGDVVEFVGNPYGSSVDRLKHAECTLGDLGVQVALLRMEEQKLTSKQLAASCVLAERANASLTADLVRLCIARNAMPEQPVYVRDVLFERLDIRADVDAHTLCFEDCYIHTVDLEPGVDSAKSPRFVSCFIGHVEGRVSANDLPSGLFDDTCAIENFGGEVETTRSILRLDLPIGLRVLLTVLKKLFTQKGAGRKENALYRGLDDPARMRVPEVLRLVESERLAVPSRRPNSVIWVPNREHSARVGRLLQAPTEAADPLVKRVMDL